MSTSSAHPERLDTYRDEVGVQDDLVVRAVSAARQALATYLASSPDVPVGDPPFAETGAAMGEVVGLARQVAQVAEAFRRADATPGGGASVTTDRALAATLLEHFPGRVHASLLRPLADDVAVELATAIDREGIGDPTDPTDLRGLVPPGLASDPDFARLVLRSVDPERFASLVERLAQASTTGDLDADLVFLADLFAVGAGVAHGSGASRATEALLADPSGRNAVRILRSASAIPLDADTLEDIALATTIGSSSAADGPVDLLRGADDLDHGDDAVLQEIASVPGLALRLLTGPDPTDPAGGRVERLVEGHVGGSTAGVAAVIDAARRDPHQADRHGALTPAGLALATGTLAAVAALPHERPASEMAAALRPTVTAMITDHLDRVVARTQQGDADEQRARVQELTSVVAHVAEDDRSFDALTERLLQARHDGTIRAIDGDHRWLERAGRFDAIVERGAARADRPLRPYDPILDLASLAITAGASARLGAVGKAAGPGIQAVRDAASEELAEEPGTSGARFEERTRSEQETFLALVDAMPGDVVWAGSGVADRAALGDLQRGPVGDEVLSQWEAAQDGPFLDELDRLRSIYRRGRDLPGQP